MLPGGAERWQPDTDTHVRCPRAAVCGGALGGTGGYSSLRTSRAHPMLAVVLAAGKGSRMAPLNAELPKALVPTLDAPQLAWVLAGLRRAGLDRVWVNTHAGSEAIELVAAQEADRCEMRISVSHEREAPLGTAGAL